MEPLSARPPDPCGPCRRPRTLVDGLIALVSAVGPAFLLYVVANDHLAIWDDSVSFIAAAEGLGRSAAFTDYDGSPFVCWPPLLPLLLFLGGAAGIKLSATALLLNTLGWFGTALVTGLWARRLTDRAVVGHAAAFALSMSSILGTLSSILLTETIFSFFFLLSLYLLWKFLTQDRVVDLALAGVVCGLAVLTHWRGLFLWLAGAGAILIASRRSFSRRLALAGLFSACSLSLLLPWLAKSYLETGTLTGPRYANALSLGQVIEVIAAGIGRWWLPARVPGVVGEAAGGLIVAVLLAASAFSKYFSDRAGIRAALLLLGGASGVYLGCMLLSAALVALNAFGERYEAPLLAPAAIAVVLAIFGGARRLTPLAPVWRERIAVGAAVAFLFVGAVLSLLRLDALPGNLRNSGDLATAGWSRSPALAYVRSSSSAVGIFSNYPDAIYLHTGRFAYLAPQKGAYASNVRLDTTRAFAKQLSQHPENLLIWFIRDPQPTWLFTPAELSSGFELTPIEHFADADLFLVRARRRGS